LTNEKVINQGGNNENTQNVVEVGYRRQEWGGFEELKKN
jgi:hypothetical protein